MSNDPKRVALIAGEPDFEAAKALAMKLDGVFYEAFLSGANKNVLGGALSLFLGATAQRMARDGQAMRFLEYVTGGAKETLREYLREIGH